MHALATAVRSPLGKEPERRNDHLLRVWRSSTIVLFTYRLLPSTKEQRLSLSRSLLLTYDASYGADRATGVTRRSVWGGYRETCRGRPSRGGAERGDVAGDHKFNGYFLESGGEPFPDLRIQDVNAQ